MDERLENCPCCCLPTLGERAGFEICIVCRWEDDGQDTDNANEVLGGPNGLYSLADARKNYLDHGHMYAKGEGTLAVENPSRARHELVQYIASISRVDEDLDPEKFYALIENAERLFNK